MLKIITAKRIILILLFINAITALFGGGQLMFNPDGKTLNLATALLNGSVFSDYFIPGFSLFVFIGIFSVFLFFNIIRNKKINSIGVMLQGGILLVWLGVQVYVIQSLHIFQLVYAFIAVLLLWFGFLLRNNMEE